MPLQFDGDTRTSSQFDLQSGENASMNAQPSSARADDEATRNVPTLEELE
ncbi:MAG: hypothetical protein ABJB04_01450 [Betaproteobacteria bacterium]